MGRSLWMSRMVSHRLYSKYLVAVMSPDYDYESDRKIGSHFDE